MTIEKNLPSWLVYERCVAAFAVENYGSINVTVQPNVKLKGEISDKWRQIDILVDARWDDNTFTRMIIDAKQRDHKIDINDVEAFEGMMKDCRAARGVIVCTNGFTDGALKRAQDAITITILTFEEIEEYEWEYEECLGPCSNSSKEKGCRGMVLWAEYLPMGSNDLWLIVRTGKCDGCHSFHVWCWDCGEKFAVPDKKIVMCGCDRLWASVPESRESGHLGIPKNVWLMMREDNDPDNLPIAIDRRPIR